MVFGQCIDASTHSPGRAVSTKSVDMAPLLRVMPPYDLWHHLLYSYLYVIYKHVYQLPMALWPNRTRSGQTEGAYLQQ